MQGRQRRRTHHAWPKDCCLHRLFHAAWDHVSLTHVNQAGTYGLSIKNWRYIKYAEGGEELYHIEKDPHEWSNLVGNPEYAPQLEKMRALAPRIWNS